MGFRGSAWLRGRFHAGLAVRVQQQLGLLCARRRRRQQHCCLSPHTHTPPFYWRAPQQQLAQPLRTTGSPHVPFRMFSPSVTKQECPPSPSRSALRGDTTLPPPLARSGATPSLPELLPSAKRGRTRPVEGPSHNASNANGTTHAC